MASISARSSACRVDDPRDLGVKLADVDDLAGVLGLDVGRDRDVVAVLGDRAVLDQRREVVDVLAGRERVEDLLLVVVGELVLVALAGELRRGVDEQRSCCRPSTSSAR